MTNPKLAKLQAAQQSSTTLGHSVAACGGGQRTDAVPSATLQKPNLLQKSQAMGERLKDQPPVHTCQQKVSISVFFDGTGNNLKADLPTLEHSNVARMFRAHMRPDDVSADENVHPIYVPGIGTLFPEIGDNGKGPIPLVDTHNGMGAVGQKRLDWAFEQLELRIAKAEARAKNPTNKIVMISLSVFGFSRGATLARAFVRDLIKPDGGKCLVEGADQLRWKRGRYPFEIRFVGLWDTVASVGLAMSANNVKATRSSRRTGTNAARRAVDYLVSGAASSPTMLRAIDLAFGAPGADPAPGSIDGHGDWADGLEIPGHLISGQCVHMIAGHEQRNSFPVDSVLRGAARPANTKEFVYPGMHSDVGGGYRPGEGGKGKGMPMGELNPSMAQNLGRISLRAMYDEALLAGVPLRRMNNRDQWKSDNIADFETSPALIDRFTHYMAEVKASGIRLGDAMLAHMRKYFEWRFHHILHGARTQDIKQIEANEQVWKADEQSLAMQKSALAERQRQLRVERDRIHMQATSALMKQQRQPGMVDPNTLLPTPAGKEAARAVNEPFDQRIMAIDAELADTERQVKELQAREDTLPSRGTLAKNLTGFDAELLDDAQSISAAIEAKPALRQQLRPHYRHLLEAYEAEKTGKGLRDEKIIAFFDNYVHDSLADFDKDCTLPSDPRVVYVGGDTKMLFANVGQEVAKSRAA